MEKVEHHSLVDHRAPETDRVVFSCAEQLKLVVVVRLYDRIHFSGKDVCKMLDLEPFRKRLYELHYHCHFLAAVKLLLWMQAVVAGSAVLYLVTLAEVIEQQLSAA